jgi:hypothetical protein
MQQKKGQCGQARSCIPAWNIVRRFSGLAHSLTRAYILTLVSLTSPLILMGV